jgi:inorganic triphosphatase YgiF
MANEIELKLSLPRKALPALRRHPLILACEPQGRTMTLDNVYFDTP